MDLYFSMRCCIKKRKKKLGVFNLSRGSAGQGKQTKVGWLENKKVKNEGIHMQPNKTFLECLIYLLEDYQKFTASKRIHNLSQLAHSMLRFMCILVLYLWSGYDFFFLSMYLAHGGSTTPFHVYFTYFLIQISIF